jgi:hypothetical protein
MVAVDISLMFEEGSVQIAVRRKDRPHLFAGRAPEGKAKTAVRAPST